MKDKLIAFIKKPTSKHIIINTIGNYLNLFFVALFTLLLVRILDKSEYAVLSVLLAIAYVLASVLDFGLTATTYSFLPPLMEKKSRQELYQFIKSTFFYQSLFSIIIIGLLIIFFPYLDEIFFKTGAPIHELYLTAISVLFFIWQNFVMNILFAAKKFFKANIYLNTANLLKTTVILFLAFTHTVTVGSIIFVFGILGPLIFFSLILLEKRNLLFIILKSKVKQEEFRFGYTFTYFIAAQFYNVGMRMDLFLLSYFRTKSEVADYGLSQKIILTIISTVISITQVLSPGFSHVRTKSDARREFKHGLTYLLLPSLLFVVVYFLPKEVFSLVFTNKFGDQTAAITKTYSLLFIIFTLANVPSLFLAYSVKKPIYLLVTNIFVFFIMTAGSYLLIPVYGVYGPLFAIFASFIVMGSVLCAATWREYQRLPEN